MRSIILGAAFAIILGLPAIAQTNSSNQNPNASTTGTISSQNQAPSAPIREQVQQNLSKAGFTDIKIMPESFLVRAKDPSGSPIMMVINPDSVTAVTYGSTNTNTTNGTASGTSATPNTNRSNR